MTTKLQQNYNTYDYDNSGALARAKRARSGAPWVRKFGYDVAYAHPYTHFM